jgi:hypothetical protein
MFALSCQEHTAIETKPDHSLDDLRLNSPWPELKSYVESIDLNVEEPAAHKHIPYVVILVKVAEEWAQHHSGNLPSTREEKNEFKVSLLFVNQQTVINLCFSCDSLSLSLLLLEILGLS